MLMTIVRRKERQICTLICNEGINRVLMISFLNGVVNICCKCDRIVIYHHTGNGGNAE